MHNSVKSLVIGFTTFFINMLPYVSLISFVLGLLGIFFGIKALNNKTVQISSPFSAQLSGKTNTKAQFYISSKYIASFGILINLVSLLTSAGHLFSSLFLFSSFI